SIFDEHAVTNKSEQARINFIIVHLPTFCLQTKQGYSKIKLRVPLFSHKNLGSECNPFNIFFGLSAFQLLILVLVKPSRARSRIA
ncbi:MAG: hypothetical protein KAH18_00275, partial [Psychromonas sp.]|nr:hypothetical protein [Psychromonas sp.]